MVLDDMIKPQNFFAIGQLDHYGFKEGVRGTNLIQNLMLAYGGQVINEYILALPGGLAKTA
jgi:hypothetical protein